MSPICHDGMTAASKPTTATATTQGPVFGAGPGLSNIHHLTPVQLSEPHHPTETVLVEVTNDLHCCQVQW